jgi:hypothetical protein
MLQPTGLASPFEEGLKLGQSASMYVVLAYHLTTTTTTFKKGDGLRGFNFVTK